MAKEKSEDKNFFFNDINKEKSPIQFNKNSKPYTFNFFGKNLKIHEGTFNPNQVLGDGNFGSVYDLDVKKKDGSKPKKPKVVKLFNLNSYDKTKRIGRMALIKREEKFCRLTSHLKARKAVEIPNNYVAMIMNKCFGQEFYYIMEKLIDDPGYINISERLEITYKLLLALRDQVQQLKPKKGTAEHRALVHADLKPSNIMVFLPSKEKNLTEEMPKKTTVSIVDYGIAQNKGEKSELRGTFNYLSPEVFEHSQYSLKSDTFATGKIISLLWFKIDIDFVCDYYIIDSTNTENEVKRIYNNFQNQLPTKEFVKELPFIRTLIQNMMDPDPEKRPDIHKLIEFFEKGISNYPEYKNIITPDMEEISAAASSTSSCKY